MIHGTVEYH